MDPLGVLAPEAFEALVRQNRPVMSYGALATRLKALITVALPIPTRCEHCRRVHLGCAREARATPEEGGPAYGRSKRTVARLNPDGPT